MSSTQPSHDPLSAGPPPDFGCALYSEGPGVARVTPRGELDLATAPQLDDALFEAAQDSVAVILDLSELTFIDSSGLHAILTAKARLAEAACRLVLLRGGHQVHRMFELSGGQRFVEFVSARDADGLASVRSR